MINFPRLRKVGKMWTVIWQIFETQQDNRDEFYRHLKQKTRIVN